MPEGITLFQFSLVLF